MIIRGGLHYCNRHRALRFTADTASRKWKPLRANSRVISVRRVTAFGTPKCKDAFRRRCRRRRCTRVRDKFEDSSISRILFFVFSQRENIRRKPRVKDSPVSRSRFWQIEADLIDNLSSRDNEHPLVEGIYYTRVTITISPSREE